jgi:hypothetical protein
LFIIEADSSFKIDITAAGWSTGQMTSIVLYHYNERGVSSFIIDHCLCTSEDIAKLKHVKIRDDGASGYSGYWSAQYTMEGADIKDITAVIILNSHYLLTVEQMERTLAHEFGHHWTLSYFMDRYEMIGWFNEPAPRLYYRIRGLDPATFAKNYSKGWGKCDKEVLAEDYKHLYSPYSGAHRMKNAVGNPTTEVKDYIRAIGRPIWA